MTDKNVTPLNVPHKDDVFELVLRFIDVITEEQPSSEVLLAAVADFVTSLTTFEGTANAYDYVVKNARDESDYVFVKRAPKPTTVTPFASPKKDDPQE